MFDVKMLKQLVSGLLIMLCITSPVEGRGLGGLKAIRDRNVTFDENYEPDKPLYVRCLDYVHQKLEFKEDPKFIDIWYSPISAFEMGKGDCDEHGFCLDYLLERKGVKSRIVVGSMNGDFNQGHIWNELEYRGRILILDSCSGKIHDKEKLLADPHNNDYIEYPKKLGYDSLIASFKKRYKSGNNKPMIVKISRF